MGAIEVVIYPVQYLTPLHLHATMFFKNIAYRYHLDDDVPATQTPRLYFRSQEGATFHDWGTKCVWTHRYAGVIVITTL